MKPKDLWQSAIVLFNCVTPKNLPSDQIDQFNDQPNITIEVYNYLNGTNTLENHYIADKIQISEEKIRIDAEINQEKVDYNLELIDYGILTDKNDFENDHQEIYFEVHNVMVGSESYEKWLKRLEELEKYQ